MPLTSSNFRPMGFINSIAETLANSITSAIDAQKRETEKILDSITDPLAREIEWTPLLRGGAGFSTHNLVLNTNGNLEFQPAKTVKAFAILFIFVGIILNSVILIGLLGGSNGRITLLIPFLLSLAFILGGFLIYSYFSKPIVFDKQNGYFYKGKVKMTYGLIDSTDKNIIPLSSIRAIQIITEKVHTKNSSFPSYEINLVLDDKKRINVVDHGYFDGIKADSKQLGEYLGVPVWGL